MFYRYSLIIPLLFSVFCSLQPVVTARYLLPFIHDVIYSSHPDYADMANATPDDDSDPEMTPGLFQGDIAMEEEFYRYWRIGIRWDVFPERLWKNGLVPYSISPLYAPSHREIILKAIKTLNAMTCIRFVPWDGETKDYLLIWPVDQPKGCWSFVGKYGGAQVVSLEPPNSSGPKCLKNEGRALHELMHALGVFHEQSRWDRDNYVEIHEKNIISRYKKNFDKQSLENTTYNFEYDYDSIMHYGKYFFSKSKKKPTITTKMPHPRKIGQRKKLSKGDCLKLNDLYGCLNNSKGKKKYYDICNTMGL